MLAPIFGDARPNPKEKDLRALLTSCRQKTPSSSAIDCMEFLLMSSMLNLNRLLSASLHLKVGQLRTTEVRSEWPHDAKKSGTAPAARFR